MKKNKLTNLLGVLGGLAWTVTILLRELSINNKAINFVLGIMPNIGAVWLFLFCIDMIYEKKNIDFNIKVASISALMILIFGIISEIIHDKFLNSPFDMNDIIATIGAAIVYLICFYFIKKSSKEGNRNI